MLQVTWLAYMQQYAGKAFEGPQYAKYMYIAYRQLVRWRCWGTLEGKTAYYFLLVQCHAYVRIFPCQEMKTILHSMDFGG